jgi:hypothetical protein
LKEEDYDPKDLQMSKTSRKQEFDEHNRMNQYEN